MKKTKLAVTLTTSALLAGQMSGMGREELRTQLAQVEPAKEAEPVMSAMCYEVAAPPQRIEYVCPTCGERSYYSDGDLFTSETELAACRRLFQTLPKREMLTLDESSFCLKCSKEAVSPELVLIVRYADGKTESARGINSGALTLLGEVLEGRTPLQAAEVQRSALGKLTRLGELVTKPAS